MKYVNQLDYPDMPYITQVKSTDPEKIKIGLNNTVAKSGCGLCSAVMVASRLRVDDGKFEVEKQFKFKFGDWPSEVQLNGSKDKIYWLNDDVWEMDVNADRVPVRPFLPYNGTLYYGLTICPHTGDVYVADAIDYVQQGKVYRYSKDRVLLDEFYVGIIPGAFCWK